MIIGIPFAGEKEFNTAESFAKALVDSNPYTAKSIRADLMANTDELRTVLRNPSSDCMIVIFDRWIDAQAKRSEKTFRNVIEDNFGYIVEVR